MSTLAQSFYFDRVHEDAWMYTAQLRLQLPFDRLHQLRNRIHSLGLLVILGPEILFVILRKPTANIATQTIASAKTLLLFVRDIQSPYEK